MDAGKCGYSGRWAFIDLTRGRVEVRASDPVAERDYLGGRGVGAWLIAERMKARRGPVDPLGPDNRIVLGGAPLHGTRLHTAGRGSASFISPMTRSARPLLESLPPVHGLATHSSIGGRFASHLRSAGIDQVIIDGRAPRPVRIAIVGGAVTIVEAGETFFQDGSVLPAGRMDALLQDLAGPGSASVYLGPAGWSQVPWACLTTDTDRNFGRGGAGCVFGSKNLVAVSVSGTVPWRWRDQELFQERLPELEREIAALVADPSRTVHFRPEVGTTYWLDRAQHGGYLGRTGGYLPWHNYDEGQVEAGRYQRCGTGAFLAISDRRRVCQGCREVLCSRLVRTGEGLRPRPEFETAALFINCGITEREDLVRLNHLCNELGADTMSTAAVLAAAMELDGRGVLGRLGLALPFGDAEAAARAIRDIAHRKGALGDLFARDTDAAARAILERAGPDCLDDLLWCLTTAYAGLGYAGIEPKAFPAMLACYATSSRGRGDHTAAWTVQAEEEGLAGASNIAAVVAASQCGKALTDSLGICDFFPADVTGAAFLDLYWAVTGQRYSAQELVECGRRIVALERAINGVQGRDRAYDAYLPPKLLEPMSRGPMRGRKADPRLHGEILDAYYREQGWTREGRVPGVPQKVRI